MRNLNKEQAVFVAALVLVSLLLFLRLRSSGGHGPDRVRGKSVEAVELEMPEVRVVDRDATIWSLAERDVFEVPREVEDLPPIRMPLPPIPPRPIVAPFLEPVPSPDGWDRHAQPFTDGIPSGTEVAVDDLEVLLDTLRRRFDDPDLEEVRDEQPSFDAEALLAAIEAAIEDRDQVDLGLLPEAADAFAELVRVAGTRLDEAFSEAPPALLELRRSVLSAGLPVAVAHAVAEVTEEAPPLEERFDRVFLGSTVSHGRILLDDPLDAVGEPLGDGSYAVAVPEVPFALYNERSGRQMGTTSFPADKLDGIAPAATLENRIRLRERELRSAPDRLALASWCAEREAYDAAIRHYRAVFDDVPGYRRDAALGLIEVLRRDYRWDELASFLDRLEEQGVEDGGYAYERGVLLDLFGPPEAAAAAFERSVELEPGRVASWIRLGRLRYELGDPEAGLAAFRRAEDASRSDLDRRAEATRGRVACLLVLGRTDEARGALDRALRDVGSDHPELAILDATLLMGEGRLDAARRRLKDVPPSGPHRRDLLLVSGTVAARQGRFFDAVSDLERARDLDRVEAFWPTAALGFVHLVTGRLDGAYDAIARAIELRPHDPYAHYLLARFFERTGNLEQALAELRKANEQAPDVTEILGELGTTLLRLEQPTDARRYLEELARRRPESADTHALLASAWFAERRYREARAADDRALGLEPDHRLALLVRAALDYRDGGEGVYQAIGALDRVAGPAEEDEPQSESATDPLGDYALTYRAAIEDNQAKCRWEDGFNRVQIVRDWELEQGHGVQIKLADGSIRFEGIQKPRNEELTFLEREMEHRQVVRFEARLRADTSPKARVGIAITLRGRRSDSEVQGGILFGRDPRGRLAYRVIERGEPGDWVVLDTDWPGSEWVTLAIENHDLEEGFFRLLADGREVARDIEIRVLRKPRSPVRVGLFTTASIGTRIEVEADDVEVIMIREES